MTDTNLAAEIERMLDHFDYEHLPAHLQAVSSRVYRTAHAMAADLGHGPDLLIGLQKLVEAKDWFVRQAVADAHAPQVQR